MRVGCFGANMGVKGYRVMLEFELDPDSSQLRLNDLYEGHTRVNLEDNFQSTFDGQHNGF